MTPELIYKLNSIITDSDYYEIGSLYAEIDVSSGIYPEGVSVGPPIEDDLCDVDNSVSQVLEMGRNTGIYADGVSVGPPIETEDSETVTTD